MNSNSKAEAKTSASFFSKTPQIGDVADVIIEKMTFQGDGLARHDGIVYFVPYSAPSDRLRVRVIEIKKNFVRAEIVETLQGSSARVEPLCSIFSVCGGCQWQHLKYSVQLEQKEQIVLESLAKVGFDLKQNNTFEGIIASPKEYAYRNRIQVHKENDKLGFHSRKSNSFVEAKSCLIAEEAIGKDLQQWSNKISTHRAELYLDANESVCTRTAEDRESTIGFSQVNRFQNKKMIETVLAWVKDGAFDHIYDLYAGAGNFSFPLAHEFSKTPVSAVELSAPAITRALDQLKTTNSNVKNLKFFCGDVESWLRRELIAQNSLILVDPPRVGLSENTVRYLSSARGSTVQYISCDPTSLARDLKRLRELCRFELQRAICFDMFPQTFHVETLVQLHIDSQ